MPRTMMPGTFGVTLKRKRELTRMVFGISMNIDWYWGLFSGCNFINCDFADCAFAGTRFPDSRFVDCKLVNCRFTQDDLGGDCDFSKTIAYGCSVESSLGFGPFSSTVISTG
jgi:uncharacterized protein YjbI with pentapeptide repeats